MCNLVLTLWEATSVILHTPRGSVELICPSAGVFGGGFGTYHWPPIIGGFGISIIDVASLSP